jgi:hypothetical protein
MAAIDLAVREVEDVTENTADRRAHCVQDSQWLVRSRGHRQNPRGTAPTGVQSRETSDAFGSSMGSRACMENPERKCRFGLAALMINNT